MKSVKQMLEQLNESGMSQQQIARLVETTQPTINRILKSDNEPLYSLGKRIEGLYQSEVNNTKTDKAVA